jgi:hypothetical protein
MHKYALDLFFLLLFFEGAIRKWLLPGLGTEIQILRDILPGLAALLYFLRPDASRVLPFRELGAMFYTLLGVYALVCFAQLLNPELPSVLIGILGLRTHLCYLFLAYMIPRYLGEWQSAITRFHVLLALSLPICALAVFQTTQPYDSAWNLYANGEDASAFFGESGLVRATGTFSYITGMSIFAQFIAVFALTLILAGRAAGINQPLCYTAIALATMGAIATGSRSVVFGIMVQVLLVIALVKLGPARRYHRVRDMLCMVSAVSIAVLAVAFKQVSAFVERAESSYDVGWRVEAAFWGWADYLLDEPLGIGIGSGHQAAARLIGGIGGFSSAIPEEELSRAALELGVGFLVFAAIKVYAIILLARKVTLADSPASSAFVAFATSVAIFGLLGALYTPITNALFWTSLGLAAWVLSPAAKINGYRAATHPKSSVLRRLVKGY